MTATTLPLTTVAVTTVAIGLTAAYTVASCAPDALETFDQLPLARVGVEELIALLSVLINLGAIATVLAGPGSIAYRIVWSFLILLPLGMLAYVAFCRRPRRAPPLTTKAGRALSVRGETADPCRPGACG